MALEVEDGTGKANAESYASVAEFKDYWTKRGDTTLAGKTDEEIEQALRKGTDALDGFYIGQWKGVKTFDLQALAWPRTGVVDYDNLLHDDDYVPAQIKYATIVLAGKSFSSDLQPDSSRGGTITRQMNQVGPIVEDISYADGSEAEVNVYSSVKALVQGFVTSGNTRDLLRA